MFKQAYSRGYVTEHNVIAEKRKRKRHLNFKYIVFHSSSKFHRNMSSKFKSSERI